MGIWLEIAFDPNEGKWRLASGSTKHLWKKESMVNIFLGEKKCIMVHQFYMIQVKEEIFHNIP